MSPKIKDARGLFLDRMRPIVSSECEIFEGLERESEQAIAKTLISRWEGNDLLEASKLPAVIKVTKEKDAEILVEPAVKDKERKLPAVIEVTEEKDAETLVAAASKDMIPFVASSGRTTNSSIAVDPAAGIILDLSFWTGVTILPEENEANFKRGSADARIPEYTE